MDKVRTCPFCQTQLIDTADHCHVCGASISVGRTTITNPPSAATVELDPREIEARPPVGVLALYIMGSEKPVVFQDSGVVLLGRAFSEDQPTHVDLDVYHAYNLGVSRMHARISINGSGCTLTDLKSTNGTWVNETALDPHEEHTLHNGDMVRLGQLVMFVYFM